MVAEKKDSRISRSSSARVRGDMFDRVIVVEGEQRVGGGVERLDLRGSHGVSESIIRRIAERRRRVRI